MFWTRKQKAKYLVRVVMEEWKNSEEDIESKIEEALRHIEDNEKGSGMSGV